MRSARRKKKKQRLVKRMYRYGPDRAGRPGSWPPTPLCCHDWGLSRRSESTWFLFVPLWGSQLFFSPLRDSFILLIDSFILFVSSRMAEGATFAVQREACPNMRGGLHLRPVTPSKDWQSQHVCSLERVLFLQLDSAPFLKTFSVVADFLAASSRLPLACGTPRYL